jgi:hypothetical protein
MADATMSESTPCQFDAGGWNPCEKPSDNGWCSEHEDLKCRSCGERAITKCHAQMGGLACGALLCASCEHGGSSTHITKEAANALRESERAEQNARAESRTSPVRRMNVELGVPTTLFELLKGDWWEEGYVLESIYYLLLRHGLMPAFPAVFSSNADRIVFASDLSLLERVWRTLEPRPANLNRQSAYVNQELGIAYLCASNPNEQQGREPHRLITATEVEWMTKESEEPFKWPSGLMGDKFLTRETFLTQLEAEATAFDPRFRSTPE